MRDSRKSFVVLAVAATLSLTVQARETNAPPLQALSARAEHPEEGVTISHVSLRRTFRNNKSVNLEISHSGYCYGEANSKPILLSSRDYSVNVLNFDTGAHMCSAVVVLCSSSTTQILSNFDDRVIAACGAEGKYLRNGYVCVSEVRGRTVGVHLMRRGLKSKFARFRISLSGDVKHIAR